MLRFCLDYRSLEFEFIGLTHYPVVVSAALMKTHNKTQSVIARSIDYKEGGLYLVKSNISVPIYVHEILSLEIQYKPNVGLVGC